MIGGRCAWGAALLLLCVLALPVRASGPKLALSTQPYATVEPQSFECGRDRVYAILEFSKPVPGRHLLEVDWYRPDGARQERTKVPLAMGAGSGTAHAWLEFHFKQDVITALSGESGDRRFDGEWRADIYWDREKVAGRSFRVDCG